MAEEVGAAYVSLIPSARGFSKLAERELRRELRGKGLAVPITPEVDRRSITAAFTGTSVTAPVAVEFDRGQVTAAFMAVGDRLAVDTEVSATELSGETRRAIRATEATRPTVNVGVDVDRAQLAQISVDADGRSLGSRLGFAALTGLGDTFRSGLGTIASSITGNPIVSTIGLGLALGIAAAALPVLATAIPAAISAALIGGAGLGVLGLGAWLLREDPEVKAAAGELAATAQSVFQQAASPLRGPFLEALTYLRGFVTEIGPDLKELFAVVAPAIMPLTRGLAGFIEALMPGFTVLARAATPFLMDLESTLPRLGRDLGAFFGMIAAGGPGASQFFRDLLHVFGFIIKAIGLGIVLFTHWYLTVRQTITSILEVLRQAVEGHRQNIADIVAVFRWLRDQVLGAFNRIRGGGSALIGFFKGIPGRIKSALGNTGSLLYQAGRNVVQGLINGIRSMLGRLADTAGSLAGTIRNYLPFSPAKEGPLSGRGNPFYSGQSIAGLLADGMESQLPQVSTASSHLAGAVGFGTGGRGSAASATAPAPMLDWAPGATGDRLLDALRDIIRVDFRGNVQDGLGTGRAG